MHAGAIGAFQTSLIINNNEFFLYNNSENTNSMCFSKSYSQSILFAIIQLKEGEGPLH